MIKGNLPNKMDKKVSIIIPVKKINDYIKESLKFINKLNYEKNLIEVIILPDEKENFSDKFPFTLKIIETGPVYPGIKRDIGYKNSTGEIIAFIDDDVYPSENWLLSAVKIFEKDENIGAIGGPAITPPSDSYFQKVSGFIYSSFLGGGNYSYRYLPQKARQVDDYPSCNLIIRKDVLDKINGFNTEFWPGEDTVICLKIIKNLKMKIFYDPNVLVYHHRRKFPAGHLNQVKSYGLHRGYFVKKFPETSFRLSYFFPSLFVLYLLSLLVVLPFIKGLFYLIWLLPFLFYIIFLIIDGIRFYKYLPFVMVGIFITHIFYGVYFIKGLLAKRLKEETENK